MPALTDLLRRVVEVMDDLEIPYFITGSVASTAYGEFRSTADVDIVAAVEERHVRLLCAAFPSDSIYIDELTVRDAIRSRGQFNIIDGTTGYKADIMIPSNSALDKKRFARARRIPLANENRTYWFSSPEDVIIKKLEFYREGQSEKHLRDIAGIVQTKGDELDSQYIQEWTAKLGLHEIWRSIIERLKRS